MSGEVHVLSTALQYGIFKGGSIIFAFSPVSVGGGLSRFCTGLLVQDSHGTSSIAMAIWAVFFIANNI
jgi:hypothetical protein